MQTTEDLPIAEEIDETPTALETLIGSFLKRPETHTAFAIRDYLLDAERYTDANEFWVILRDLCSSTSNGFHMGTHRWAHTVERIRALFWFDIYSETVALNGTMAAVHRLPPPGGNGSQHYGSAFSGNYNSGSMVPMVHTTRTGGM